MLEGTWITKTGTCRKCGEGTVEVPGGQVLSVVNDYVIIETENGELELLPMAEFTGWSTASEAKDVWKGLVDLMLDEQCDCYPMTAEAKRYLTIASIRMAQDDAHRWT